MRMYEVSLRSTWSVNVAAGSRSEALQEARNEIKRIIAHFEGHLRDTSPLCVNSIVCDIEPRGDVIKL